MAHNNRPDEFRMTRGRFTHHAMQADPLALNVTDGTGSRRRCRGNLCNLCPPLTHSSSLLPIINGSSSCKIVVSAYGQGSSQPLSWTGLIGRTHPPGTTATVKKEKKR